MVYKVKATRWHKQDKMFFLHPNGPTLIIQYLEPDVLQRFRCVNKAACAATTAEVRTASVSNALAKYQKLEPIHITPCDKYIYQLRTPFGKGRFCISQAAHSTKHTIPGNAPLNLHIGSGCMEGGIVDAYSRKPDALPARGNHLIRLAENVRLVRVFYDGKAFKRPRTLPDVKTVTIDTEMDLRISNEPTQLATYMVKLEFTAAAKPAERTLFSPARS